ncbi:SpaH/EbpB family LPXTG-anchored major pilin [Vagococcus carniphilus]|uniref:Uncharacterized protein n=1 Tax=Vagococcus carniphilus TaxID=218144 RepID=A0A430B6D7_9ENTE|nr:SpaH/EbpB family LPXTG-anchored major pilin [Vagococcus carniphilus]QNN72776.1 SpaH/EbpB family LPXTG-anchored major pilin [Vagococcus carniphilus]RSU15880.1 hypothetical protein CBF28_05450 [Vagococcus carniphilus]
MNKKLGKIMTLFVLVFPLLAGMMTTTAQAADGETVSINLHKRVFEKGASGENPYPKQNTGEIMEDFGGEPLNNVTFEAYDVTNKYIELLSTLTDVQATAEIVKNANASNYAPDYATKVGTQKTAGEGIATFADLPLKDEKGKFKTYLFVETNSPANIKEKAAPIVLTMPLYKGDTEVINENVHIYPKNEKEQVLTKDLSEESKKKLTVTIDGKEYFNVEQGVPFGYELSALIPWNVKDREYYKVTDTPNKGMQVLIDTVKVEGLDKDNGDFTVAVDASGRGFVVTLNTSKQAVMNLAGKRAKITYDAYLTEDAAIDTGINNTAVVEVGPGPDGEGPEKPEEPVVGPDIYTGGKKFEKVDDKSGKTLAGAKFNLVKVDKDGKVISYATLANGKYTWSATADNATSFESDTNGKLEVKGLEYSEKLTNDESYALVEYEAPTGYAKLDKPVKFNVVKDEFTTQTLEVKNIKKGLLPSTGGNGIYLFLAVGSLLMVGAAVWYRRTQVEVEV